MASAEAAAATIAVDLVQGLAPRSLRRATLTLAAGATIRDALEAAAWPELAALAASDAALAEAGWSVAVWNHGATLATVLQGGDRIELLRALVVDPMTARRARYEAAGGVKALRKRRYDAQFTE